MKGAPLEDHTILIYCPLCGNRSSVDLDTGEEHDMVFRVTPNQLAILRADLAQTTCLFCDSPMAIKLLDGEPDELQGR